MLTATEIKNFIDNDAASDKKRFARTGLRYYEADHDIRNYRVFFIDADGNIQEDTTKAILRSAIHSSLNWWIRKCSICFLARKAL